MEHRQALPKGTILPEGFQILDVLGVGGFGITYLVEDLNKKTTRAIKEYFPSSLAVREATTEVKSKSDEADRDYQWALKRFTREAETIARFKHKNIVRVFNIFPHNNTSYMVLEYIEGPDMDQWLKATGEVRHSQQKLDELLLPLLDALETVHENHILHRDIKPSNIIIRDENGSPVLLDFGAAKYAMSGHTASSAAIVSRFYSPYESYAAENRLQGAWTDIYGLAATFHRILTGAPPSEATSRVIEDDYVPIAQTIDNPEDYRPGLLQGIDFGLAVMPDDRPQTIDEWRSVLLSSEPVELKVRTKKTPDGSGETDIGIDVPKVRKKRKLLLPVGLGIATTGIAASLGVALVNPKLLEGYGLEPLMRHEALVSLRDAVGLTYPVDANSGSPGPKLGQSAFDPPETKPAGDPKKAPGKAKPKERKLAALKQKPIPDKPQKVPAKKPGPIKRKLAIPVSSKDVAFMKPLRTVMLSERQGHAGQIYDLSVAKDSNLIGTGGEDGTVKLWNASSGKLVKTIIVSDTPVRAVAITPDGNRFVSGGDDGMVRVWEIDSERVLWRKKAHKGVVHAVAISSDGEHIASAGEDRKIKLWDVFSGSARTLKGHTDTIRSLAFSPDGKHLVSGSIDQTIRLWRVADKTMVRMIDAKSGYVAAVRFSSDGTQVLAGGANRRVEIWDWQSGRFLRLLNAPQAIQSVAFSPDQRYVAAAGLDNSIHVWDTQNNWQLRVIEGHGDVINTLEFSRDGRLLMTAGSDQTLRVWQTDNWKLSALFGNDAHSELAAVAYSPKGDQVASAGANGSIKLWDRLDKPFIRTFETGAPDIKAIAFAKNGSQLVSVNWKHKIKIWDTASGSMIREIDPWSDKDGKPETDIDDQDKWLSSLAVSPDGAVIVTAGGDKRVKLWNGQSGQLIAVLTGSKDWIQSVALSPDGRLIASGGSDGEIRLWDVLTRKKLGTLKGHESWVQALVFDSKEKRLFSGSADNTVREWNIDKMREVSARRKTINGAVWAIALSGDDRRLAAAGDGKQVTVWQLSSGQKFATFSGHTDTVRSLDFSSNGRRIVSVGDDGAVRAWQVVKSRQARK